MIAKLYIQTAFANSKTILKECFCTTPFKVANITENKKDHTLRLMIMSSSPGILDGDDYEIKIDIAQNCSLQLQTQSYQRLFTMQTQAVQTMQINLANNASFYFIAHPIVPHKNSNYSTKNKIFLTDKCSLIFGEILTCGRKLNNEVFTLSRYHSLTEIFINNKLVLKENLLVQPSLFDVNALGQLKGYTHQASLIFLDEEANVKQLIPLIVELLSAQKNISAGVTAAFANGIMVRLLGQKAEQLFTCLQSIAGLLHPAHKHNTPDYAPRN